MTVKNWLPITCCALALALASSPAQEKAPAPKAEKVTKLDGTSFFGIVTLSDDYTLKISNDSGLMKIPLALLGERDFKKFGLQKDRSKDGRFWSERKDALEDEKKEGDSTKDASQDHSAVEIQLSEIAVFQPVIAAYEATLIEDPKPEAVQSPDQEKPTKDEPGRRLFSGPGTVGNLQLPFSGPGSSFVQPAISAGSSAIQSAGSVVPGLPAAP